MRTNSGEINGGLRERKKEATRKALHEATMRLAVEHGLDEVTVEAIADAAGVSRRTFSNYFAGKEDALLYGDEQRIRVLMETFGARPPGESSWTALRVSFHAIVDGVGEADLRWAAQARLARVHSSVQARQLARYATFELTLAELIAARDGLPPGGARSRAMAGAFMAALRIAAHVWSDERSPRTLGEIADELLDELATPFE
ncbi:TetR/AcrR family transcriptional regulator [Actinomadura rubrisoli]|uniref:TetR family transcriptional regulator n=1 Tax=Actinomadura rubrisoli TaxID=2530368 RepID=A0A4R5BY41_9ACTN|nr:TetR/AcrR family transcriptional regulator [Actinomadura rubrisoli]TDD92121.1 TetR family transcriptional regulator [Actinomadura rubrisoli]